jgi:transcription termination factor NusB
MSKTSSRILSRKLVFLYYYARLFNEEILAHPQEVDEVKKTHETPSHEDLMELTDRLWVTDDELNIHEEQESSEPHAIIVMNDATMQDDIEFIAQHQLPQHTNSQNLNYDKEFVMQLTTWYTIYRELIAWCIAPYTDRFEYDEMSLTRRAILLLGYAEHKIIGTPGTIVINECVELAKSYEDVAAGKLINGIMHQLFDISEEEKEYNKNTIPETIPTEKTTEEATETTEEAI